MSNYAYKFFGRIGNDREQLIRPVESPETMFVELADLRKEFGGKWEIWIERFHAVHPHVALQRRIDGFAPASYGPKTIILRPGEGYVEGWIQPQFHAG